MPIHPLAVVDPAARVHPDAIVGPFCLVRGPAVLEAGVELVSHATVLGRTTLGEGTKVFPGAVVGGDPQDLKFRGEDSEVTIGRRCRIHECSTINKGTAGGGMKTVVGDDCLIMAYSHLGHDCILAERVIIGNAAQLAGHVHVGARAVINAMVGVHQFASVGELAYVGAMDGIKFDLPPFMICEGNPAEPRTVNQIGMRRAGYPEEQIRATREAYRILFHDKTRPRAEALDELRDSVPEEGDTPVHRLVRWMERHLDQSVKGRVLEAERPPVVGGGPAAG
jgi:UDP-N-acetylglucosamine acyltransferase